MTVDINAPIIPYQSIGGIKLYSSADDLISILSQNNVRSQEVGDMWIKYEIDNIIELYFHKGNNKLFRITTLDGYKGKLFEKIFVGMKADDLQEVEASFWYDEFEEVWESSKGVFIETDAEINTVRWISIYVQELNLETFDNCEW